MLSGGRAIKFPTSFYSDDILPYLTTTGEEGDSKKGLNPYMSCHIRDYPLYDVGGNNFEG